MPPGALDVERGREGLTGTRDEALEDLRLFLREELDRLVAGKLALAISRGMLMLLSPAVDT